MSEQDKRPVYMGTFDRHRKEMSVRLDDVVLQLNSIKQNLKYTLIVAGVGLGVAIVALLAI
jgi:hypothetical protein